VKTYTAHIAESRPPQLVREGFAWGAAIFGPLWLLRHRAWLAAIITLCLTAIAAARLPAALPLLAFALGLFGNDLRRLSLHTRGFIQAHVIAASNEDAAYARLLAARPDIAASAAL
jgi:hypothetical protein